MIPMSDEHRATEDEEARLQAMSEQFLAALADKDAGRLDAAEEAFAAMLKAEPRLPEPRMELARIHLDTDRLADAESHARLALEHLEAGGRWTDMLPPGVVEAMAHALLAEILRRRLEDDEVIFGDPEDFKALLAESKSLFTKAHSLDPTDATSSYYAFFLGPEGHGGTPQSAVDEA
jgi:tetratricopeptide (TPR) repeat protein